jgi:hypothetical protein
MRDVYEVLRTKELEMENLRIEIEALRIAAPLLSDDGDNNSSAPASTRWVAPTRPFQVPQAAQPGQPRSQSSTLDPAGVARTRRPSP